MTRVINLFGAPGAGKSTTAAALFAMMKTAGINCELVHEYAKELAWMNDDVRRRDNIYIFAEQNRRQRLLVGKVDYIITDSPIILGHLYAPPHMHTLRKLSRETFDTYINVNFLIERADKYNPNGRFETSEESYALQDKLISLLEDLNVPFKSLPKADAAPTIFSILKDSRNGR